MEKGIPILLFNRGAADENSVRVRNLGGDGSGLDDMPPAGIFVVVEVGANTAAGVIEGIASRRIN